MVARIEQFEFNYRFSKRTSCRRANDYVTYDKMNSNWLIFNPVQSHHADSAFCIRMKRLIIEPSDMSSRDHLFRLGTVEMKLVR